MKDIQVFEIVLGLGKPRYIESSSLEADRNRLDIHADFLKGASTNYSAQKPFAPDSPNCRGRRTISSSWTPPSVCQRLSSTKTRS